jgi:hypothetical protein
MTPDQAMTKLSKAAPIIAEALACPEKDVWWLYVANCKREPVSEQLMQAIHARWPAETAKVKK